MKQSILDDQQQDLAAAPLGRGADVTDLRALRDRIGTLTSEQSGYASVELEARRAAEDLKTLDLALAAAINAEAQALELENHRRAVRLLAIDGAAGIGSFLLASMLRDGSSR